MVGMKRFGTCNWTPILLCCAAILLWLRYQVDQIPQHQRHSHNTINYHKFLDKGFDAFTIGRTSLHHKDLDYWYNYIHDTEPLRVANRTLTLLHFDSHGTKDNQHDSTIHTCSPLNLHYYPEFVVETLDSAFNVYSHKFEKKELYQLYYNIRHKQEREHWEKLANIYDNVDDNHDGLNKSDGNKIDASQAEQKEGNNVNEDKSQHPMDNENPRLDYDWKEDVELQSKDDEWWNKLFMIKDSFTEHATREGWIKDVVWIIPSHWNNSQLFDKDNLPWAPFFMDLVFDDDYDEEDEDVPDRLIHPFDENDNFDRSKEKVDVSNLNFTITMTDFLQLIEKTTFYIYGRNPMSPEMKESLREYQKINELHNDSDSDSDQSSLDSSANNNNNNNNDEHTTNNNRGMNDDYHEHIDIEDELNNIPRKQISLLMNERINKMEKGLTDKQMFILENILRTQDIDIIWEAPSSRDYLQVNIWVLTLETFSEYYLNDLGNENNELLFSKNLIFDFDLDYFSCQEPAHTIIEHGEWNLAMVDQFNNILQQHQYVPSHMLSENSNAAIVTLIGSLLQQPQSPPATASEEKEKETETEAEKTTQAKVEIDGNFELEQQKRQDSASKTDHSKDDGTMDETDPILHPMPTVQDMIRVGIEHGIDLETIERSLYLLYQYQHEREKMFDNGATTQQIRGGEKVEGETVQHLMHYDTIFKIIDRAHEKLEVLRKLCYDHKNDTETENENENSKKSRRKLMNDKELFHKVDAKTILTTHKVSRQTKHKGHLQKIAIKYAKHERLMAHQQDILETDEMMHNEDEIHEMFDKFANRLIDAQIRKGNYWLTPQESDNIRDQVVVETDAIIAQNYDPIYRRRLNQESDTVDDSNDKETEPIRMFSFDNVYDCEEIGKNEEYLLDYEILDIFGMTTDYLYHGHESILFDNETNPILNKDHDWKYKYPQFIAKMFDFIHENYQLDDNSESTEKVKNNNVSNKPKIVDESTVEWAKILLERMKKLRRTDVTKSKDWEKKKANIGSSHVEASDVLSSYFDVNITKYHEQHSVLQYPFSFDQLDPVQKHFIQHGNHYQLKNFVKKLNAKQKEFLNYLLFCYAHHNTGTKYCDYYDHGAMQPKESDFVPKYGNYNKKFPNFINEEKSFGDIRWHKLNAWPKFVPLQSKSDVLQIDIDFGPRTDGILGGFIHDNLWTLEMFNGMNHKRYKPSMYDLMKQFKLIHQIIAMQQTSVKLIGIETSPGHISIDDYFHHKIECHLLQTLKWSMWQKNQCFARYRTFERDDDKDFEKPFPMCHRMLDDKQMLYAQLFK